MSSTQDENNIFGIKVMENDDGEEHGQVTTRSLTRDDVLDVEAATRDDAKEVLELPPKGEQRLIFNAESGGIFLRPAEEHTFEDEGAMDQQVYNRPEAQGVLQSDPNLVRPQVSEGESNSRQFLPQFLPDERSEPQAEGGRITHDLEAVPYDNGSKIAKNGLVEGFPAERLTDDDGKFEEQSFDVNQVSDLKYNPPELGDMHQQNEPESNVEQLLTDLRTIQQEQEQTLIDDQLFPEIRGTRQAQEETHVGNEGNHTQDYFSAEPSFDIGAGVLDSFLDEHEILPPVQGTMNDLNEGLSFLNLSEEDFLLEDEDEAKAFSELAAPSYVDEGATLPPQQTTSTGRYTPRFQSPGPPLIPSNPSLKSSKPAPITVPPPYAAPSLFTPSPYTLPSPYVESRPSISEKQESFVSTNKAYSSPYDLPTDVVPKRTRVTSHPLRSVMKPEDIPPPPLSAGLPPRNAYQPSLPLERSGPNRLQNSDQRISSAPAAATLNNSAAVKSVYQKQPTNAFDPPMAPQKRPSFNRGASSRGPSKLGMYTTEAKDTPQTIYQATVSSSSLPVHRTEDNLLRRYPICRFAFGGRLVRSIPRVSGFNWVAGDVQVHKLKDFVKIESFPGPLVTSNKASNKSKKDEALKYATRRTENEVGARGLLWAVLKLLLEHSLDLSGRQKEIHHVLIPELGLGETANFQIAAEVSRRMSVGSEKTGGPTQMLKNLLLRGDREAAVRHAIDHKLFAHALLIASTISRGTWKEAVKAFVSVEVSAEGNESLATLFQVFSGAGEDAIDELLPSSFMTGYSIIPAHSRQENETFSALVKWRETLSMILSNRSTDDVKAIVGLGRVLLARGWTEAAHICFLFAGKGAPFGPREDKNAFFSLVGADLERNCGLYLRDVELIRMTEVYELALSQASNSLFIPHMQAYKLHHAWVLTDYGFTAEATKYCELLQQLIRANPKIPAYSSMKAHVDYLAQILESSSATWLGKKLSRPKLWGKFEGSFQKFIAGDETNHEKPSNDGLFAKVAATPAISRQTSNADMYTTYAAATYGSESAQSSPYSPVSIPPTTSRYAPLPKSDMTRGFLSRPSSAGVGSNQYQSRPTSTEARSVTLEPSFLSPYASKSEEVVPFGEPGMRAPSPLPPRHYDSGPEAMGGVADTFGGGEGTLDQEHSSPHTTPYDYSTRDDFVERHAFDEGPAQILEPDSVGEDTTVEAGMGEPALDSHDEARKVEEEFEDFGLGNSKPANPKLAEDAMEGAVGAKGKGEKSKKPTDDAKGWFGGWFKKKEADGLAPKAVKAKLGESMSMIYDPEQKRWVSPNAPASVAPAATLPPPKRAVSAAPSTTSVQSAQSNASVPPLPPQIPQGFTNGPASTAPTPPRTLSPLSRPPLNASTDSMDDLLAAATARKGSGRSTVGKSKRRYVVQE